MSRGANVRVIEGPERAALAEKGPRRFYHVLVVDTIRGRTDMVERELMTREAVALYVETLVDDGVLLLHTSNREFDLVPAVADVAHSLGLPCVELADRGLMSGPGPRGHFTSQWVLIARSPATLARIRPRFPMKPGPASVRIDWRPM
jgi:hypothetical protein